MSSSLRSGSVSSNSRRHPGCARETICAAGPVCQTLRNQSQSNPSRASRSSSASGTSSRVARLPSGRESSVSQTRVLIWYSDG